MDDGLIVNLREPDQRLPYFFAELRQRSNLSPYALKKPTRSERSDDKTSSGTIITIEILDYHSISYREHAQR